LHPQAVHFGLSEDTSVTPHKYEKHIRNISPPKTQAVTFIDRRLEVDTLAQKIVGNLTGPSGPVSKFALQMIEGVELVRFRRHI